MINQPVNNLSVASGNGGFIDTGLATPIQIQGQNFIFAATTQNNNNNNQQFSSSLPANYHYINFINNQQNQNNTNPNILIKNQTNSNSNSSLNSNYIKINKNNDPNNVAGGVEEAILFDDDKFSRLNLSSPLSVNSYSGGGSGGSVSKSAVSPNLNAINSTGNLFDTDDFVNAATNLRNNNNNNMFLDLGSPSSDLVSAASLSHLNSNQNNGLINQIDMNKLANDLKIEDDNLIDYFQQEPYQEDENYDSEDDEEDEDESDEETEGESDDDLESGQEDNSYLDESNSSNSKNQTFNSSQHQQPKFCVGSVGSSLSNMNSNISNKRNHAVINSRKHARINNATGGVVDVHHSASNSKIILGTTLTPTTTTADPNTIFSNIQFLPFNNSNQSQNSNNNSNQQFQFSKQQQQSNMFLSTSLPPLSNIETIMLIKNNNNNQNSSNITGATQPLSFGLHTNMNHFNQQQVQQSNQIKNNDHPNLNKLLNTNNKTNLGKFVFFFINFCNTIEVYVFRKCNLKLAI